MRQHITQGIIIGTLACAMSLLIAHAAQAQLIHLGQWDGSLEAVADIARLQTKTKGVDSNDFDNTRLEEQLMLRNSGIAIYDPRLINLSLGGTFGFSQEWVTMDSGNASRHGTLNGYDVFAGILQERPFALNLFANRSHSLLSRELAGRTDILTENRGLTLFANTLYVPSSLTLRHEMQDDQSQTAGVVSHRRNKRSILTYEGERGWVDSDIDIRYELIDDTDVINPSLSYRSHDGNIAYGVDFGSELNWHLDSRLSQFHRSGTSMLTTRTLDELLRIEHSDRLRTDYRYIMLFTDAAGGKSTTHTASFNLQHQLYESLTTTFGSDGIMQQLPGGEKDLVRGHVNLAYTKYLPRDGRLNAAMSGGLEYENDRFNATVSFVPQESHTISSLAFPIILRNAFVASSSVVVTKTAFGPLPPGCLLPQGPPTVLVLGRDYSLRQVGNLTQIVPAQCSGTSPGINPGDTIAADYQFDVSRSLTFTTANWQTDLSVDYRWIRPYLTHTQSAQHLLSGEDGRFLDDRQSDAMGTELRFEGKRARLSIVGQMSRFNSGQVSYNELQSTQFLSVAIRPDLTLNASADQTWMDFMKEDHQTISRNEEVTLAYTPTGNISLEAYGNLRLLKDRLFPTEHLAESGLRLHWLLRELEVNPTVALLKRRRGDTEMREFQAMLRMLRRF